MKVELGVTNDAAAAVTAETCAMLIVNSVPIGPHYHEGENEDDPPKKG